MVSDDERIKIATIKNKKVSGAFYFKFYLLLTRRWLLILTSVEKYDTPEDGKNKITHLTGELGSKNYIFHSCQVWFWSFNFIYFAQLTEQQLTYHDWFMASLKAMKMTT